MYVHTAVTKDARCPADPLVGWLLPSTFLIGGSLAAALIASAVGMPERGSMGETLAPELPSIGMIIGASASQSMQFAAVGPASTTPPSFAFGFLEFDWDPNAPGGVPGFDSWPKHDLSVAEASPRS
jgi:hypothetical protein